MIFETLNLHPLIATTRMVAKKDERIFSLGDISKGVFFVEKGAIDLMRFGVNGEYIRLHSAKSGQGFAEASLFSDVYHCDAIAPKASVILRYEKNSLLHALRSDHDLTLKYMKHLSGMVQLERSKAELRGIRLATTRVLTYFQLSHSSSNIMEMAAELSLSHEACYRALRTLCDEGRLQKRSRGQYTLPH